MKTKVPAWVSILIVTIAFIIVGFIFWWYTGGKSEYESNHPSAETLAWRKEFYQSGTVVRPPLYMTKPAPPTKLEFSAQTVDVHIANGKKITDLGRLYYMKGNKFRDEYKGSGGLHTTITRFDKRSICVLSDKNKTYTEEYNGFIRTGMGDQYVKDTAVLRKDPTCKHLGTERISGNLCDKYTQGDPGSAVTIWISRKIPGLCMKTVYQTESIRTILADPVNSRMKDSPDIPVSLELRNVRLGRQPDSLFEVPKGYKSVTTDFSTGLMILGGGPSKAKKPK